MSEEKQELSTRNEAAENLFILDTDEQNKTTKRSVIDEPESASADYKEELFQQNIFEFNENTNSPVEKTANSAEFQSGQSSNQPSQAGDQTDEQDLSVTFSSTDLLTNRPETENGVFSVTAVSVDPEFGSITDNADGSWTFTPAEDFTGKDVQVKFSISDDLSGNENIVTAIDITPDSNNGPQNPVAKNTDSTAVPIYPNAVNEAPIVGQVDLGAIKEDSAIKFSAKELLAHSSDADGDSLSVVNVSVDEQYGKIEFNTDNAGH